MFTSGTAFERHSGCMEEGSGEEATHHVHRRGLQCSEPAKGQWWVGLTRILDYVHYTVTDTDDENYMVTQGGWVFFCVFFCCWGGGGPCQQRMFTMCWILLGAWLGEFHTHFWHIYFTDTDRDEMKRRRTQELMFVCFVFLVYSSLLFLSFFFVYSRRRGLQNTC